MRKISRTIVFLGLILALAEIAWGKAATPITLPVTNAAAVGLNSSQYIVNGKYAHQAIITFDGDIRVFFNGTVPTPAVGHYYYGGASLTLDNAEDIANFKCVAVSGPVTVTITLWF